MAQRQKNLLYTISKDFLISTSVDTAILTAKETFAVRFNLKDPKFATKFCNEFKQVLKVNATSVVTYNVMVAALEFALNKEHVFATRLYIEMGSAATATIIVRTAIMKDRRILMVLLWTIFSASVEGVSSIFRNWQNGGEEYLLKHCPYLHDLFQRNPFLPQMIPSEQQ